MKAKEAFIQSKKQKKMATMYAQATKVKSYIDERSNDEIIEATEPLEKHEHIVADIVRDQEYCWHLGYYADTDSSSYDAAVARLKFENMGCKSEIDSCRALIQKLTTDIENARRMPNDPKYKKTKKGDTVSWDRQIVQAQEDVGDHEKTIEINKAKLKQLEWNRYLELAMNWELRRLRNKFQRDLDMDYLKRGVTRACSYNETRRHEIVWSDQD